jgi:phage terminase large subunit-like protein
VNSIPTNLHNRIGDTIKQEITVKEDRKVVQKARKKKIKKYKAFDNVQKTQQQVAKLVDKKGEFEAVRNRLREQYLEKKVGRLFFFVANMSSHLVSLILWLLGGGRRPQASPCG